MQRVDACVMMNVDGNCISYSRENHTVECGSVCPVQTSSC